MAIVSKISPFFSSSTLTGYKYYEVNNNISSRSTIVGEENTNVFIQAGNRIDLMPDFRATLGGNFRAIIAPCGTGVPNFKSGGSIDE